MDQRTEMRSLILVILAMALASCGGGADQTGMPTAVFSETDIERLESKAAAFAEQHLDNYESLRLLPIPI